MSDEEAVPSPEIDSLAEDEKLLTSNKEENDSKPLFEDSKKETSTEPLLTGGKEANVAESSLTLEPEKEETNSKSLESGKEETNSKSLESEKEKTDSKSLEEEEISLKSTELNKEETSPKPLLTTSKEGSPESNPEETSSKPLESSREGSPESNPEEPSSKPLESSKEKVSSEAHLTSSKEEIPSKPLKSSKDKTSKSLKSSKGKTSSKSRKISKEDDTNFKQVKSSKEDYSCKPLKSNEDAPPKKKLKLSKEDKPLKKKSSKEKIISKSLKSTEETSWISLLANKKSLKAVRIPNLWDLLVTMERCAEFTWKVPAIPEPKHIANSVSVASEPELISISVPTPAESKPPSKSVSAPAEPKQPAKTTSSHTESKQSAKSTSSHTESKQSAKFTSAPAESKQSTKSASAPAESKQSAKSTSSHTEPKPSAKSTSTPAESKQSNKSASAPAESKQSNKSASAPAPAESKQSAKSASVAPESKAAAKALPAPESKLATKSPSLFDVLAKEETSSRSPASKVKSNFSHAVSEPKLHPKTVHLSATVSKIETTSTPVSELKPKPTSEPLANSSSDLDTIFAKVSQSIVVPNDKRNKFNPRPSASGNFRHMSTSNHRHIPNSNNIQISTSNSRHTPSSSNPQPSTNSEKPFTIPLRKSYNTHKVDTTKKPTPTQEPNVEKRKHETPPPIAEEIPAKKPALADASVATKAKTFQMKAVLSKVKELENRLAKAEQEIITLHELLKVQDDITEEALAILPKEAKFEEALEDHESAENIPRWNKHTPAKNNYHQQDNHHQQPALMYYNHQWFGDTFLYELFCRVKGYKPKEGSWFTTVYPYCPLKKFSDVIFSRKRFYYQSVVSIGYSDLFDTKAITGLEVRKMLHGILNYMEQNGAVNIKFLSIPPARQMMKNEQYLQICQTTNRFFKYVTRTHPNVDFINLDKFFVKNFNNNFEYFNGPAVVVEIMDYLLMRKENERFEIFVEPQTANNVLEFITDSGSVKEREPPERGRGSHEDDERPIGRRQYEEDTRPLKRRAETSPTSHNIKVSIRGSPVFNRLGAPVNGHARYRTSTEHRASSRSSDPDHYARSTSQSRDHNRESSRCRSPLERRIQNLQFSRNSIDQEGRDRDTRFQRDDKYSRDKCKPRDHSSDKYDPDHFSSDKFDPDKYARYERSRSQSPAISDKYSSNKYVSSKFEKSKSPSAIPDDYSFNKVEQSKLDNPSSVPPWLRKSNSSSSASER